MNNKHFVINQLDDDNICRLSEIACIYGKEVMVLPAIEPFPIHCNSSPLYLNKVSFFCYSI